MARPKLQTRVDPETKERVAEYADRGEHDVTESDATRELIHAGLAAKGLAVEDDHDDLTARAGQATGAVGVALTFAAAALAGTVALTDVSAALTVTLALAATVGGFGGSLAGSRRGETA